MDECSTFFSDTTLDVRWETKWERVKVGREMCEGKNVEAARGWLEGGGASERVKEDEK